MDRRAFLKSIPFAIPTVAATGVGVASLTKMSGVLASVTPQPPIYVAGGYGTSFLEVCQAIKDGASQKRGLIFEAGQQFEVTNTANSVIISDSMPTMTGDILGVPPFMLGYGATLIGRAGGTVDSLVTINNPQSSQPNFHFAGFLIDCGSSSHTANHAIKIYGSQNAHYEDLTCQNSADTGIYVYGESGAGVYYNSFSNILVQNGASTGWHISTNGNGTYYIASNTYINCKSQHNSGYGWYIDYANDTFVGCDAEGNTNAGFYLVHTSGITFMGGYTENNPSGSDVSFYLNAQAGGVKIFGGRQIGSISNNSTQSGNVFFV